MDAFEEQDFLQKRFLSLVQSSFPLTSDPYGLLAEQLGVTSDEAYQLMQKAREDGFVRRMGPVFDSYKLGYVSTLCATRIPNEKVEDVANYINSYPNVTHNYLRENTYNVWFTVIARGDKELKRIVDAIEAYAGSPVLPLPALSLFKIKVDFNLSGEERKSEAQEATIPQQVLAAELSENDKVLIRIAQAFPYEDRYPFRTLAEEVSKYLDIQFSEQEVIDTLIRWKKEGIIRRFGVTLKHHQAGLKANVMVVWNVADEEVEKAGKIMAAQEAVSHCYERPRFADWPSNVYTMIHGKTRDDCNQVISDIKRDLHDAGIDVDMPLQLHTLRELKKTSMKYFCEENV